MKMKRLILISFTLFFVVSALNLDLIFHYCEMTESVSLEPCSMCKAEKPAVVHDCCAAEEPIKSETTVEGELCCKTIEINNALDNARLSESGTVVSFSELIFEFPVDILPANYNTPVFNSDPISNAPPGRVNQQIYKQNSSFLI